MFQVEKETGTGRRENKRAIRHSMEIGYLFLSLFICRYQTRLVQLRLVFIVCIIIILLIGFRG